MQADAPAALTPLAIVPEPLQLATPLMTVAVLPATRAWACP
jgi:hypothetical protein